MSEILDESVDVEQMPEADANTYDKYEKMLQQSELAVLFKKTFESIRKTGTAHVFINGWMEILFCFPPALQLPFGWSYTVIRFFFKNFFHFHSF